MFTTSAIILLLVILNGLFVAAEFAILGAPPAAIKRRALAGSRIAAFVLKTIQDTRQQDRYIATAQLGITFASLGLGMYGEHTLAQWLSEKLAGTALDSWIAVHTLASIIAIALLTYLHIVLGEMIPKSFALQRAEQTAIVVSRPMRFIQLLMYPLVVTLNWIGESLLRLIGIRRAAPSSRFHTPEEIEYLVEESQEGGVVRREVGQVLRELLTFDDLIASQVMTPRVKLVGMQIGATAKELALLISEESHTRYPVYEQDLDHIVGFVHIKDILGLLLQNMPLSSDIVREVPFLPGTANLETVFSNMQREGTQMIVVLDEHGGTAGIITIEDLFEEVVGEFHEEASPPIAARSSAQRALVVHGTTRIAEVGELLGIELSSPEVDSISGLILSILERPPLPGDRITFGTIELEVLEVEGRGVESARITYKPQDGDSLPREGQG